MTNPWVISLLVGGGGFVGSLTRYGLAVAAQRIAFVWPLGTLAANILGCLIIGIITGLAERSGSISPAVRLAVATGFCGGLTTMSSMIYETGQMLRDSEYLHAGLYAAGSFFISMLAFVAGIVAVRILIRLGGGLWS